MARKKFDAYRFLTHAIWHCQWSSEPQEEADLQAAKILTDLRSEIAREAL